MAFTKSWARRSRIIAKIESAYASDPSPSASADGMLTFNSAVVARPEFSRIELRPHGTAFTRQFDIIGKRIVRLRFSTYFQGSGTAGDNTIAGFKAFDALLRACAMAVTTVASTSITYAPAAMTALESCTIYAAHGQFVHKVNGCVGNVTMTGNPRDGLKCDFTFTGIYSVPVAIASIFNSWSGGTQRARAMLGIGLTLNNGSSYTPVVKSVRFDRGNQIEEVEDCNAATGLKEVFVADANPMVTTTRALDSDSGATTTYDEFYTDLTSAGPTTTNCSFALGSVAGNTGSFSFPKLQLVEEGDEEERGHLNTTDNWKVTHTTDNAEFSIALT